MMFLFTSRQTDRIFKNPIIAGILRSVVTQPMSQSANDSNVKTEEETLAGGFGLTEIGDDSGVEQESDFFFYQSVGRLRDSFPITSSCRYYYSPHFLR